MRCQWIWLHLSSVEKSRVRLNQSNIRVLKSSHICLIVFVLVFCMRAPCLHSLAYGKSVGRSEQIGFVTSSFACFLLFLVVLFPHWLGQIYFVMIYLYVIHSRREDSLTRKTNPNFYVGITKNSVDCLNAGNLFWQLLGQILISLVIGEWRWARSDLVIRATHPGVLFDRPCASYLSQERLAPGSVHTVHHSYEIQDRRGGHREGTFWLLCEWTIPGRCLLGLRGRVLKKTQTEGSCWGAACLESDPNWGTQAQITGK